MGNMIYAISLNRAAIHCIIMHLCLNCPNAHIYDANLYLWDRWHLPVSHKLYDSSQRNIQEYGREKNFIYPTGLISCATCNNIIYRTFKCTVAPDLNGNPVVISCVWGKYIAIVFCCICTYIVWRISRDKLL